MKTLVVITREKDKPYYNVAVMEDCDQPHVAKVFAHTPDAVRALEGMRGKRSSAIGVVAMALAAWAIIIGSIALWLRG